MCTASFTIFDEVGKTNIDFQFVVSDKLLNNNKRMERRFYHKFVSLNKNENKLFTDYNWL